jgi:hypothetical protein
MFLESRRSSRFIVKVPDYPVKAQAQPAAPVSATLSPACSKPVTEGKIL